MIVTTTYYGEVAVLPFPVGAPMGETLEWLTDVFNSHDGTEVAAQMRNAPRQIFQMHVPIPRADNALAFHQIYGGWSRSWAVPVWAEAQTVGDLTAGASTITATTDYSDFRSESLAIVYSGTRDWEIVEIQTVGSGVLNLLGTLSGSYTAPLVAPVRVGRISPVDRHTDGTITSLDLHFTSEDNAILPVSAPTQYNSVDLYYQIPKFVHDSGITDEISTRLDVVDFDLGTVEQFTPWNYARKVRPIRVVLDGAQEAWEFREWLHRRAGRYRTFWTPTYEKDLTLVSTGALTTSITVEDDGFLDFGTDRTHLAVRTKDGSILPRAITNSVAASSTTTTLTLDTSLAIDASHVERISYLGLYRLNSDRVEMQWLGGGVLQAVVPIIEVSP